MGMLDDAGVSYQLVLTKTDKADAGELAQVLEDISGELGSHGAAHPEVCLTSAVDRRGIAKLQATLAEFALAVEQSR
jgi:GTP-binding protein